MISTHFNDIRSVKVIPTSDGANVMLRIGAYDKISIAIRSEAQARIIADAFEAALDLTPSDLDKRSGGA